MPNKVANMQDVYKGVSFDPTDDHHAPWQSGMTGLGYDVEVTGDLTSLNSLWEPDPRWTGKVTFLTEMRDTIGLTMLKLGKDPSDGDRGRRRRGRRRDPEGASTRASSAHSWATSTPRTWSRATSSSRWPGRATSSSSRPRRRRSSGSCRTRAGCSGPTTCSSRRAPQHKYTAELFVNFVYDPAIAAQIAAWVNYVTPVKGAKEVLAADDPEMAENPLIFPPEDVLANVQIFKGLTEDEETHFNDAFSEVTGN